MKNFIKLVIFILVVIWCVNECSGCSEDRHLDNSESVDYSWINGTWKLTVDGFTHTISFNDGLYVESYRTDYGSSGSASGYYTIESENNRIRLNEYGDNYPSYIEIEGKRLKADGHYYRKK